MIRTNLRLAIALLSITAAALAAGCGDTTEKRQRSAQPAADRYYEYINVGDYEGAYRHTLSKTYKAMMEPESFVTFRQMVTARTGPVKGRTLVESSENPATGSVRLVYALQTDSFPADPPREILDMVQEDGEWRVGSLDVKMPKTPQPTLPSDMPLPGPGKKPAAPQPGAPPR